MTTLQRPLFLLVLLLVPTVASAQVPALDQGSLILGGQASLTSTGFDDDDSRTTGISIAPRIQYFVVPGLALGADVILARSSSDDFTTTGYALGPIATYYLPTQATAHPFVSGSVLFGQTNRETPAGDVDSSESQYRASVGLLFFLTDAVGISTELFYTSRQSETESIESDSDAFGLAVGFSAFIF
jgi:hypothetical protein